MKIIQCGDFHLDSRINMGLSPAKSRAFKNDLLTVFDKVIDTALQNEATVILVAGDLFDTDTPSESTRTHIGEAIESHPEITFFAVNGNHDRHTAPLFREETPANWHVFPEGEWESVRIDEHTVICGTSSPEIPGIWERIPARCKEDFSIVLLHGEAIPGEHAQGENIPLGFLGGRSIDWLALGHEHSFKTAALGSHGIWSYAGCPAGRGFDECGDKGCVLFDTTAEEASRVQFIPLGYKKIHNISVDISECRTYREILSRVYAQTESVDESDMVLISLCGYVSPDAIREPERIAQALEDRFFHVRVHDTCRLALDPSQYIGDVSLKGAFIRAVMAADLTEEEKENAITCGLLALRGESISL